MADPIPGDGLFDLPVADFVAARDLLVRELRASGSPDAAAGVAKLRRPTLAAWAVNQVARGRPDDVAAMVAAGLDVQRAQRRALSGLPDSGLRRASSRRRTLVDELTDVAATVLRETGVDPDAHLDDVAATFEAATNDAEVAATAMAGRLSRPVRLVADLSSLSGLSTMPDIGPGVGPPDDEPDPSAEQRQAAIRAHEAARSRAARSAAAAGEAREHAQALRQRAAEARESAVEARRAADRAEVRADEADVRAADAARAGEEAATRAVEDADRVTTTRSALDHFA